MERDRECCPQPHAVTGNWKDDANFVVTGGTTGCHDNLWCHQCQQSRHHDDFKFSVVIYKMWKTRNDLNFGDDLFAEK